MDHDDGIFDEETAAEYDDASDPMFDPAVVGAAVDLLAELAGDGPALELGIGTGRIALPLAARGIAVHGIDLSRPMVARLRAKPGGADVPVTIGDFATADLAGAGPFTLVYLVYNTVMNLTTQAAQVDAFRNAARHLAPGGCFLIEVGVRTCGACHRASGMSSSMAATATGAWMSTTSSTRASCRTT